ncbi:MAG TPA: ATP-binding cassette domain-containing protein [Kiritimatiellia bacterium]|nr:ATP-binding cassette domain-containing protein [Kiritimatiellia bacterium]HSA19743.1 ATP-binding cassette domain-containing protein [Kiritimatiellia bacterium]
MTHGAAVLGMADVRKSFPSPAGRVEVLRGVDLEIRRGEFVMVTGPSGSGKTTLLNLAALLDFPTSGRLTFQGRELAGLAEDSLCDLRKRAIGVVFQRFCLLPRRTALENVLFRFRYVGGAEAETRRAALAALDTVGLAALADRPVRVLSAGEMQRVAIARAVALRPELLVADEPTGNLDAASTAAVMDCFRRLNVEGLTVLLVTHNEGLLRYATRHLVCVEGTLNP